MSKKETATATATATALLDKKKERIQAKLYRQENKRRYKLYKGGKQWLVAAITFTGLSLVGTTVVAHADTDNAATTATPKVAEVTTSSSPANPSTTPAPVTPAVPGTSKDTTNDSANEGSTTKAPAVPTPSSTEDNSTTANTEKAPAVASSEADSATKVGTSAPKVADATAQKPLTTPKVADGLDSKETVADNGTAKTNAQDVTSAEMAKSELQKILSSANGTFSENDGKVTAQLIDDKLTDQELRTLKQTLATYATFANVTPKLVRMAGSADNTSIGGKVTGAMKPSYLEDIIKNGGTVLKILPGSSNDGKSSLVIESNDGAKLVTVTDRNGREFYGWELPDGSNYHPSVRIGEVGIDPTNGKHLDVIATLVHYKVIPGLTGFESIQSNDVKGDNKGLNGKPFQPDTGINEIMHTETGVEFSDWDYQIVYAGTNDKLKGTYYDVLDAADVDFAQGFAIKNSQIFEGRGPYASDDTNQHELTTGEYHGTVGLGYGINESTSQEDLNKITDHYNDASNADTPSTNAYYLIKIKDGLISTEFDDAHVYSKALGTGGISGGKIQGARDLWGLFGIGARFTVPASKPEKTLTFDDQINVDGKTMLAGQTYNANISGFLGFYTGADGVTAEIQDVIKKGNDGIYPVSVDMSKVKVRLKSGADITDWFKITSGTDAEGNMVISAKSDKDDPRLNGAQIVMTVPEEVLHDKTDPVSVDIPVLIVNGETLTEHPHYVNTYTPDPHKHWVDGKLITDGMKYLAGDEADASVVLTLPDHDLLAEPLQNFQIYDDYSGFDQYVSVKKVTLLDQTGKDVTADYKISTTNGMVMLTSINPGATPSGTVTLLTQFIINADVPENVTFTNKGGVIVNHDNQPTETPSIVTWRPKPVKDVEIGETEGNGPDTINTMTVIKGTVVTWPLDDKQPLPANRDTTVFSEKLVDTLQDGQRYVGFKAFVKQSDGSLKDVTSWYTMSQDGSTYTFSGTQPLFDYYNSSKGVETPRPIIDLYTQTTQDNVTLVNSYNKITNNEYDKSNEVWIHTPLVTPTKEVHNLLNKDINDKNVVRGDILKYVVNWDLSDLTKLVLTPDEAAKGMSMFDDYDETRVAAQKDLMTITDKDGNSLMDQVKVAWDDEKGTWTMTPIDSVGFAKKYAGQKLPITFVVKVKKDVIGDLKNQATQNLFGDTYDTNVVVNHIPQISPTKDVVVDLGNQNSLNNTNIKLNQIFDYKLNSSVRPANYDGDPVTEWSVKDKFDTEHDELTGHWQVIADRPMTLKDGTVLQKGTDVTRYFNMAYDYELGTMTVSANKEYLDALTIQANADGEQAWTVFVQAKRIKAAKDVFNDFEENYQGEVIRSNRVVTHTPEPKKPDVPKSPKVTPNPPAPKVSGVPTPKPKTPTVPKRTPKVPGTPAPGKPVKVNTPAPAPQHPTMLPQTGESNSSAAMAGLAALGLLLAGAGYARKKKF